MEAKIDPGLTYSNMDESVLTFTDRIKQLMSVWRKRKRRNMRKMEQRRQTVRKKYEKRRKRGKKKADECKKKKKKKFRGGLKINDSVTTEYSTRVMKSRSHNIS